VNYTPPIVPATDGYAPTVQAIPAALPAFPVYGDLGADEPPAFYARGRGQLRGRTRGPLTVAPPPAFSLTPAGQVAISPWLALGLVLGAAALGVFLERRYRLTGRAEERVRGEVEDTKRKYTATKSAIKATAAETRKRVASKAYRVLAGEDAEA